VARHAEKLRAPCPFCEHSISREGALLKTMATRKRKTKSRARVLALPGDGPAQRLATAKSQRTYQRIIDAAIDGFVEDGYARSSMSSIAARARVTRSRVQYYFANTEQLLTEAARVLLTRVWGRYLDRLDSDRASPLAAFDRLMALRNDREHIAWMELVAASRTDRVLRRIVERAQREADRQGSAAKSRLMGVDDGQHNERLDALADLARIVLEALTLAVIPDNRTRRIERMLDAFKAMLGLYYSQPQRG